MKIVIIGAGPTGLGAAQRLRKLSHDNWVLYERNNFVGGLSSSFLDGSGFTWDIGGHVLFSHYSYFDEVVKEALGGDYYEHLRESWVRILKTWVPYPFQNNIRHLPDEALGECLAGLRNLAGNPRGTDNFHKWMKAVFGDGIVKYFMEPYNEKVWGIPLQEMSREWIGERVSVVNLARIEQNIAMGTDDVSWGPNNKFKFPKRGGTGAIFDGIARPFRERIHLNHELKQIDLQRRELVFSNGYRGHYDVLINTSPVDLLLQRAESCPSAVIEASNDLVHNGGLIVGLGLSGKRIDPKCWMYFPERNTPFYRVTNFYNYSKYNVPEGAVDRYFSLMSETTYSSHKPVNKATIIESTIQGLVNAEMLRVDDRDRIVSSTLVDIPYSYPVPTIRRDKALSIIQPYLESCGVYSRGRFGAWKYEVGNMDHSFMQGVEAVDRILSGKEETTIRGTV